MPKLMSFDEFQMRSVYGSTEDAYVYGMGLMQWNPSIALCGQPPATFYPFASVNHLTQSTYLTTGYDPVLSPDTRGYRKELAKEIGKAIRHGSCFLNPGTGRMETIPINASLQVEVDANENVCIQLDYMERLAVKSQKIEVSLELAMHNLRNPSPLQPEISGKFEMKGTNFDYLELAKKAKSFSGKLLMVNGFFQPAVKHFSKHAMYGEAAIPLKKKIIGKLVIDFGDIWMDKKTIAKLEKITKYGGRLCGGAAIGLGLYDIFTNGPKPSNIAHTTMSVASMIPQTRIIATVYFAVDFALSFTEGGGIGERFDRYFIDEKHTWYDAVDDILKTITPIRQPQFIDSPILIKSPVGQPISIYLT